MYLITQQETSNVSEQDNHTLIDTKLYIIEN